jgi:glucosamine 6-phosphate synthetase-like amidotransferase/phosphosugar isomerase protein
MCGIFGIIYYGSTTLPPLQAASLRTLTSKLLLAAEMRGKDASGVAILTGNDVVVYKAPLNASRLLKTNGYENVSTKINADFHAIIGHARAQTKGTYKNNRNNHPIIADKIVGVHNGMINNDDSLFLQNKNVLVRAAQVDSEIIFRLLNHFLCNPDTTLIKAVQSTTKLLTGSYACAFIDSNRAKFITLFKRWNPIDILVVPAASLIVFASVGFLARKALSDTSFAIFSVEEKLSKVFLDPKI